MKFTTSRILAFLAILLGPYTQLATHAQSDGELIAQDTQFGTWIVRCAGPEGQNRTCLMATTAVNALEQRDIAVIQILRVLQEDRKGDENYAAQLTSPTNVNVRLGIEFRVDQDLIATVPYEVCTVNNCITSFALTPDMITAMQEGFAASLTFTNAAGMSFSGTLFLEGFSRALENL